MNSEGNDEKEPEAAAKLNAKRKPTAVGMHLRHWAIEIEIEIQIQIEQRCLAISISISK